MKPFSFQRTQILPITVEAAWKFFSNPVNLVEITPPEMDFRITSPIQNDIYAGQIITYKVRPLLRLSVNWTTEITHVERKTFFVDEQRFGPYRFWHHQHHFREVNGGVEVDDLIHYLLPYDQLTAFINTIFVAPRLKKIFDFRRTALNRLFPNK